MALWLSWWLLMGTDAEHPVVLDVPIEHETVAVGGDLVPMVGTSLYYDGHEVRHLSLNVLGGLSWGLSGFEVAAYANVKLAFMEGVQVAGVTNVVLGRVTGIQYAFGANIARGDLQEATPYGDARVVGAQLAGAANCIIAGLASGPEPLLRGWQLAGGGNIIIGPAPDAGPRVAYGAMTAGTTNILRGDLVGLQATAGLNLALGDVQGAQLGAVNYADAVTGVQVGVVNVTGANVRGLQLGVINVAEDAEVPIGLVNLIWGGRWNIQVGSGDHGLGIIAVENGGRWVHSIYSVGLQLTGDQGVLALGLGIGAHLPVAHALHVDIDVIGYQLHRGGFDLTSFRDVMLQTRAVGAWRFASNVSLFAGPSYSIWIVERVAPETFTLFAPVRLREGRARGTPGFSAGFELAI